MARHPPAPLALPPAPTAPAQWPARVIADRPTRARFWADWQTCGRALALQLWGVSPEGAAEILAEYNRDPAFAWECEQALLAVRESLAARADGLYCAALDALRAALQRPDVSVSDLLRAVETIAKVTGNHKVAMAEAATAAGAGGRGSSGPTLTVPVLLTQPRLETTDSE